MNGMTGTAGPASPTPNTAVARALGDPTRAAIHDFIRDAPHPVTIAEITERLRLNHNGIRRHLGKLRDAGLVLESREPPSGRGRPGLLYTTAPNPEGLSSAGAHAELARMLLRMITTGQDPLTVGREAGQRIAAELRSATSTTDTTATREELTAALETAARRMGFDPTGEATANGIDIVLRRCPFAVEAELSPETICLLHRGIAEGISNSLRPGGTVLLTVVDPRRGGCRIAM
ncbi:helix-turn-helix transcriptional regulator [Austwickia chelonae]|uniref:helix-turn-helix transcriptional regulator n=1 Tax=Austwickia chelonae TaxID=100225 RepID=UPI000E23C060|nr:helix-turn-helix domain-containing protein [Austwickia chelonae]